MILPRLLVPTLLLLAGCGLADSLKGERQPISYYTLAPEIGEERDAGARGRIALEDFTGERAATWLQFVRRGDEETLEYRVYPENHRWWADPPVLATDLALVWLQRHFQQVERYPGDANADLVLRVRLLRFEEIRAQGSREGTALVVLRVEARPRGGKPKRFNIRTTEKIQHADGSSIDGPRIASALSTALQQALDQAAEQVKPLLPSG